jgi:microcystin-dependent protein
MEQSTLAMQQLVAVHGAFPIRGEGGAACLSQGLVHSFAGTTAAYGAPSAEGQMLQVPQNQALYSIFFTSFGAVGDNFALPALRGKTVIGGGPLADPTATTQPMTWMIAANPPAGADAPLIGSLAAFGGGFIPDGWLACDGSPLAVSTNVALYEAIGTTFGGGQDVFFKLPDLGGVAVVGAGPGGAVGSTVAGPPAGLCLNYLINVAGPVPPTAGAGAFPANQYWLGQVIAFAGSAVPPGWALADGSVLSAGAYPDLFALLGNNYGGDRTSSFALPDLRGKMVVGT